MKNPQCITKLDPLEGIPDTQLLPNRFSLGGPAEQIEVTVTGHSLHSFTIGICCSFPARQQGLWSCPERLQPCGSLVKCIYKHLKGFCTYIYPQHSLSVLSLFWHSQKTLQCFPVESSSTRVERVPHSIGTHVDLHPSAQRSHTNMQSRGVQHSKGLGLWYFKDITDTSTVTPE